MHKFTSKTTGRLALTIGILIAVSAVFLIIFFIGYFNGVEQLYIFGTSNDVLNLTVSILTCVMAVMLLPSPRRQPLLFILFLVLIIAAWIGAAIVTVDSLRAGGLMSNRTFHVLRLKYSLGFITGHDLHFGDGLVGLWIIAVNIYAFIKKLWPRRVTIPGIVSGLLYSLGFFVEFGTFFGGIGQVVWGISLSRWITHREEGIEQLAV